MSTIARLSQEITFVNTIVFNPAITITDEDGITHPVARIVGTRPVPMTDTHDILLRDADEKLSMLPGMTDQDIAAITMECSPSCEECAPLYAAIAAGK